MLVTVDLSVRCKLRIDGCRSESMIQKVDNRLLSSHLLHHRNRLISLLFVMSVHISTLQAATTPSRESLGPSSLAAEFELPDYISPPPSNDRERRAWDQFSDRMNRFHDRVSAQCPLLSQKGKSKRWSWIFSTQWKRLFTELILAAEKQATAQSEKKKPISYILALADQLLQCNRPFILPFFTQSRSLDLILLFFSSLNELVLEMHHAIEEQNIFPILARKMPVFQHNAVHLDEHAAIHAGSFTSLPAMSTLWHQLNNCELNRVRQFGCVPTEIQQWWINLHGRWIKIDPDFIRSYSLLS